MPRPEPSGFSQRFDQELRRIRAEIEMLREEQRPYFRSLADEAEQHHRSMEQDCTKVRDIVDDLHLNKASIAFDIWSTAENIKRMFASH